MAASAVMVMLATTAPGAYAQRAAEQDAPSLVRVVALSESSLPQPLAAADAARLRRAF
jgi:hypothetical protein